MSETRFRAVIEPAGSGGSFVVVPPDAVAALRATGRTSIVGTVDGHPIVGQVMPYTVSGRGREIMLGMTKAIRAAIGKTIGDEVEVVVERDDRSRSANVALPPELESALAADASARQAFDRLAPSRRREHAQHVAEAKQEATRQRRAQRVVDELRDGAGA
jgi:hypothetical protein